MHLSAHVSVTSHTDDVCCIIKSQCTNMSISHDRLMGDVNMGGGGGGMAYLKDTT